MSRTVITNQIQYSIGDEKKEKRREGSETLKVPVREGPGQRVKKKIYIYIRRLGEEKLVVDRGGPRGRKKDRPEITILTCGSCFGLNKNRGLILV